MVMVMVVTSAGVPDRAIRAAVTIETARRPRRDKGVILLKIEPQSVGDILNRQVRTRIFFASSGLLRPRNHNRPHSFAQQRYNFPLDRHPSHLQRNVTHQDRPRDRPFDVGATIGPTRTVPTPARTRFGGFARDEWSVDEAMLTVCHRIQSLA